MTTFLRGRLAPALLVLAPAACDPLTAPTDPLQIPPQDDDGWETASVESVSMDPEPLQAMLALIDQTPHHLIHGVVIVRDDKLVFEAYWPGVDMGDIGLNPVQRHFGHRTPHYVASVTKSITSALVGIAIDRGLIGNVDDSLFSYFPDYADLRTVENEGVTLRHLLSFSSGLDWNEHVYGFGDPQDSHVQMFSAADPRRMLLGRPIVQDPGSAFLYNSGDTNLLGEIVRRQSGAENLVAFADEHFFGPLDIHDYDWGRFALTPEVTFASGGAFLRPRDMAKLGSLYLHLGTWKGRRIVPETWTVVSALEATSLEGDHRTLYGYGFNWWLGRSPYGSRLAPYFRASGWGGQDVFVYPDLRLVVVFTGGCYNEDCPLDLNDLIEDFVFQAIPDPASPSAR